MGTVNKYFAYILIFQQCWRKLKGELMVDEGIQIEDYQATLCI